MEMYKYLLYAYSLPPYTRLELHVALSLYKLNPQHSLALMISIPIKMKSLYGWVIEQNMQYNL